MSCIMCLGSIPSLETSFGSALKAPLLPSHRRRNELEEVIRQNDVDGLQILIKSGVNVNTTLHKSGYTALHFAAERGFHRCLKLLLDAKADPFCKTVKNFTPLHLAMSNVQVECVIVLLKYCKPEIWQQGEVDLKEVLQMLISPVRSCSRRRAQDILTLVLTSTPVLEKQSDFKQNQLFAVCRDFAQIRCLKAWVLTGNKFNDYQKKLLQSKFRYDGDALNLNGLTTFKNTPKSLMHYCRLSIRRSFSGNCNVIYGVANIPLPEILRDFVSIPIDSSELLTVGDSS